MSYDHTQRGLIHWLLVVIAGVTLVVASTLESEPPAVVYGLLGMGLLFAVLAACFAYLRVRDRGEALEIAFGPLRLFRRSVRYDEIVSADAGRSALIDGWGVHYIFGRGWTWNIHGFEAAELQLRGGGKLRIGTDDSVGLVAFLRSRIAPQ